METIEQKWARIKRERQERGKCSAAPEVPQSYRKLRKGHCIVYAATQFDAMMTGAWQARQRKNGDIRLIYTDGTEEIANCPEIDLGAGPSWITVVGAVQAKRAR